MAQSTTSPVGGLVSAVWTISKAVAYKPLAVTVLVLMLCCLDVVLRGMWSTFNMIRDGLLLVSALEPTAWVYNQTEVLYGRLANYTGERIEDVGNLITEWRITAIVTVLSLFTLYNLGLLLMKVINQHKERLEILLLNSNLTVSAERMVPGSLLEDKVEPSKFQAEVWTDRLDDDRLYYRGVGFKACVGEGPKTFITAKHVIDDSRNIVIKVGDASVSLKPEDFVETDVDIVWAELNQVQYSKLGLATAKLATAVSPHGVWVRITALGKGTFGTLKEHGVMGMIEYAGSTVKGFSGAPYHINKTVYGMHVGADPKNVGYSASYIAALQRSHWKSRTVQFPEDSADYLCGQLDLHQEEDFLYERSPVHPDEYRVRVAGVYHIVDSDTFAELAGRRRARAQTERRSDYEVEDARTDRHFLEKRHPQEAPELPLAPPDLALRAEQLNPVPRGAATFSPESYQGPSRTAAACQCQTGGPLPVQQSAPQSVASTSQNQGSGCRSPTMSWGSYNPESMPAPPRNRSTTTMNSSGQQRRDPNKPSKGQRVRARLHAAEQALAVIRNTRSVEVRPLNNGSLPPSGSSNHGASTSAQPVMSTTGSINNSLSQ